MEKIARITVFGQDPVEVDTWYELVDYIYDSISADTVVDILKDIDMNEPPYNEGIDRGLIHRKAYPLTINGNGHKLENIYLIWTSASGGTKKKVFSGSASGGSTNGININNWDITSLIEGRYADFAYGFVYFTDCNINLKMHQGTNGGTNVGYYHCGINIEGQGDGSYTELNFGTGFYTDMCNIEINGKFSSTSFNYLHNSYVSGDFENITLSNSPTVSFSYNYLSVINATIKSKSGYSPSFSNSKSLAVNTETWTGPVWDNITVDGLIKCNTADLKSRTALKDKDFPV